MQNLFHHQDFLLKGQEVLELILLTRNLRKVFQINAIHIKQYLILLRIVFWMNTSQVIIFQENLGKHYLDFRLGLVQQIVKFQVEVLNLVTSWNYFRIIMICYLYGISNYVV